MKILKSGFKKGFATIKIDINDDLWYLENLLEVGDFIKSRTLRSVFMEREGKRIKTDRKPMVLKIQVEKIEFQKYANKCKALIDEFINNLQIFGNVETKLKIRDDDLTYVRFPKTVTDILSHLLKVKFVRTNNLPKRIFNASTECKIEAIKAFIDDEGCISTSFCVIQKSKNILMQFKRLLELVDIKTGKICNYSGIHQIYISTFSYSRFENLIRLTNTKKNRRLKAKIKNLNY